MHAVIYHRATIRIVSVSLWLFLAAAGNYACVSKGYSTTENYTETQYKTALVTETYSDNVTVVLSQSSTVQALPAFFRWYSDQVIFKNYYYLYYYAYDVPVCEQCDIVKIRISVWDQPQYEPAIIRVFDMTKYGHIYAPDVLSLESGELKGKVPWTWITGKSTTVWLDSANTAINQARFLGGRSNTWSKSGDPQIMEFEIGKASHIAVIISGPRYQWNTTITADLVLITNITEQKTVVKIRQMEKQVPYQIVKQRTVSAFKQVPVWELMFPD